MREAGHVPLSAQLADDLTLRSRLDGPIAELERLARSLLFAEISMISYLDPHEVELAAKVMGIDTSVFVDRDGAQAYVLETETDRIVACRGTEPEEFNDLKADANAFTDLAETVGRVHRGFKKEVDEIWPMIRTHLRDDGKDTWFAGHSLGGAMATICAGRCRLEDIPATPAETYTYGSPRVGTKRYVQHAGITHIRWVHNNDVITRVPPTFLGYRHTGEMHYLDAEGVHRTLTPTQLAADRAAGFRKGLRNRRLDHFSDHAIVRYVEHLAANQR